MNKKTLKKFVLLLALVIGFFASPLTARADGERTLTILHTNDIHGRAEESDENNIIGYAKYKTIVDSYKNEGPTLVLDAGDVLHGTNFATLSEGANMVELMNAVGVDAMTPGNHDFNYGAKRLLELANSANFKVLAANITDEAGNNPFASYAVFEKDGIKVGVLGLATPETKYKSNPLNTEGYNFSDEALNADRAVESLKANGVDVIVLLSHLGIDQASKVNTYTVLNQMNHKADLDVVIDGHSHSLLEHGKDYQGTMIASTGAHFANIGCTTVTIKEDGSKEVSSRLINKAEADKYQANQNIVDIIATKNAANDEITAKVVGNSKTDLDGLREHVRTGETNLADLIADAIKRETNADVVLTNGGGIRDSISKGEITLGDVLTVLPFGNQVTVIKVTGQDIQDALQHGAGKYPDANGGFPQVAGMTYTIEHKGNKSTVKDVKVNGENLNLKGEYTLATNDFMAIGGDDYTMFEGTEQVSLHGSMLDIVADYIAELSKNGPFDYKADGRIKVEEVQLTDREKLEASLEDLKVSKKALEYLEETAPKIVKKHRKEFDNLTNRINQRIDITQKAINRLK